jgi:hypothetical protein
MFSRWLWQHTTHLFQLIKDMSKVSLILQLFICWMLFSSISMAKVIEKSHYHSGRVQVSLVWNSRDERSQNAEKLTLLIEVSCWNLKLQFCNMCSCSVSIYFLENLVPTYSPALHAVSLNHCEYTSYVSSCGEMVAQKVVFIWSIPCGPIFRHQQAM